MKKLSFLLSACLYAACAFASPYLHLDNRTPATLEDLLDDPFLALRVKSGEIQEEHNFTHAWEAFARMQRNEEEALPQKLEFPTSWKEDVACQVSLSSFSAPFDACPPVFSLNASGPAPTYMWWQIADNPAFETICPSLNQIAPFSTSVILSNLAYTFLNPGQPYYFRVRTEQSAWSSPYPFQVYKPQAIEQVCLIKQGPSAYMLLWEAPSKEPVDYLIFASNAKDFIPDIFTDRQINALYQGKVIEEEPNCNLVAITSEPFLVVDGSQAFYRIIVREEGRLSVPSPLIHVYDACLVQPRTLLQPSKEEQSLLYRQQLPSRYSTSSLALDWFALLRKAGKAQPAGYPSNPFVPAELWQALEPYFLPINHPLKDKLDRIFKTVRATQSPQAFEKAGFGKAKLRQPTNIVVGKHNQLKGYLVKAYLDTQPPLCEWANWLCRIAGAQSIQACLNRHGYKHFVVPQKWIYPLPADPSPPADGNHQRKNFILIVEDMHILNPQENEKAFKTWITKPILDALYTILTEEGLIDSVFIDNIPFTRNGKIAFIDTEHHHLQPIKYERLIPFFSADMQTYWQSLLLSKPLP
ncbi:fibronectin type III domain-containing protein [Candidatus Protochlamydia phocaeensis]|uniref:fibronectin type III domain-containing protein n=1 Tax=Candidatus Protochlamydia phocaeensis TaxID=1414722 RepID=UPI0008385E44|nr:fibronectin type III domain-containing protein [Candidatus Protochlamydia phocaeensis]